MKELKMADPRTTRVSDLKPGQYADGSPLDDVQYLESKLILKTGEFTSATDSKSTPSWSPRRPRIAAWDSYLFRQRFSRPIREVMFMLAVKPVHSTTSVAIASKLGGIVRPSA